MTGLRVFIPEIKLPPPVVVQSIWKFPPKEEPAASSENWVFVQVSIVGGAINATGTELSAATVVEAEAVHPVAEFVTKRVNVPAALTTGWRVVWPDWRPAPVHKYSNSGPVELPIPFKLTVGLMQFKLLGVPMTTCGN